MRQNQVKNSADRIGVIEEDDLVGIYQLFLYFFKDYHDWLQIHESLRFPEILYILNLETYPENVNVVKFAMCLILLIFKKSRKKNMEELFMKIKKIDEVDNTCGIK